MRRFISICMVVFMVAILVSMTVPKQAVADPPTILTSSYASSCEAYLNCKWWHQCIGLALKCEMEMNDPYFALVPFYN